MRVRRGASSQAKVEQQMTPMIDVVFQLLTFFIMSFKVASLEGDFNIKMPLGAEQAGSIIDQTVPPMKLRMTADPEGNLAALHLNETKIDNFSALRGEIARLLTGHSGPGSVQESAEVELDCDYHLKYEHVIDAVTSVSGYSDGRGNIIKLVEKVKFAPPKRPAGEAP